jgi:hypothetical protein
MDDNKLALAPQGDDTEFFKQVAGLLEAARQHAKRHLDSTIVMTYYEVGRMIVEREQQGQRRAQYGSRLIKGLSEYLAEQYGRGFSVVNLKSIRKFYQVYEPSIQQSLIVKSENEKGQSLTALFEKGNLLSNIFYENAKIGQSSTALFNLTCRDYRGD